MHNAARDNLGFTLLELLLVVGIIGILSGLLIPNFNSFIEGQTLRQAQDQVITDIRSIQNRALTGVGYNGTDDVWAVKFVDNATFLYYAALNTASEGCSDVPTDGTGERGKALPGDVQVYTSGGGDYCLYFYFDNGAANDTADNDCNSGGTPCSVYITEDDNECMKVDINGVGMVSVTETDPISCP